MSLTIGRLVIDDPEAWAEPLGEAVSRVGAVAVPGQRAGLTVSAGLTTFAGAAGDTAVDRRRIRRQLRSLLNNLPMRLCGLYVAYSDDTEQNGWYVPGQASLEPGGEAALVTAFWRLSGLELALVGRPRLHRRAIGAYVRDRRVATQARDILRRIYSVDFASLTALALTWLPSTPTDVTVVAGSSPALSAARTTLDGGSLLAVVGAADLAVASFEQAEAVRNLGDVVIRDRRGTITAPAGGPDAAWEEVYGPDYPLTAADVPVLENGLCRVRYDATNTAGFRVDRVIAGAWAEQGKILILRQGDSTGYLDTLVGANVVEWSLERAVVRVVMRLSTDAYSREEVFLTLQRGWSGPRVEVYPSRRAAGTAAGETIVFFVAAADAFATALKINSGSVAAAAQGAVGTGALTPGVLGDNTFTGENWLTLLRPGTAPAVTLAVLQAGAWGRVERDTFAYGSARNGISVGEPTAGYISAHVGFGATLTDQGMEAEAMNLGGGTSSSADGAASGGFAATTTRTAEALHVSRTTTLRTGAYRIFARAKTASGTASLRAITGGGSGSVVTTTSTSYVWLNLGQLSTTDANKIVQINAWNPAGVLTSVDRVELVAIEDRTAAAGGAYDGARDLGQSILYDSRSQPTLVAR